MRTLHPDTEGARWADLGWLCSLIALWSCTAASPAAADPLVMRDGENGWKALPNQSLIVQPGSALDASALVEPVIAGKFGRVIAGRDGQLAFEKRPGERVTFFVNAVNCGNCAGLTERRADAEEYVRMMRTQGYNMIRLNEVEALLMKGATTDGEIPQANLDVLFYFLAKCRENGIYVYLNLATHRPGYYVAGRRAPAGRGDADRDMKAQVFFDPAARAIYRKAATTILTTVNPYTGLRLADDPTLAVVLFYNEQETKEGSPSWINLWREFLHQKYGSAAAVRAAWKGRGPLDDGDSLQAVRMFSQRDCELGGSVSLDISLFLADLYRDLNSWYVETLKSTGYPGLFTQWDWWKSLYLAEVRDVYPLISMHHYQDHPKGGGGNGTFVNQSSELADAASWWRIIMGPRLAGRPYAITEYNHPFPGMHRNQMGLVAGAYAALQGVDALTVHSNPVEKESRAPSAFRAGLDPIQRASMFVTGYLFQRRDAASAAHSVGIVIRESDVRSERRNPFNALGSEQSKASLLTRQVIAWRDLAPRFGLEPKAPDITLHVGGSAATRSDEGLNAIVTDADDGGFSFGRLVQQMREKGILRAQNRTDPEAGVYESETGELLLDAKQRIFTVRTPRLQGAAFETLTAPIMLGDFSVLASSVGASVTLVSVDGQPIRKSRRLVLVYATDARRSGQTFEASDYRRSTRIGELPMLIRTGKVAVTIQHDGGAEFGLWSLALNGARRQALDLTKTNTGFTLDLDTERLANGPTIFFELAPR